MRVKPNCKKIIATILVAAVYASIMPRVIGNETVVADSNAITSVELSGVTTPVAGETPTTSEITTNAAAAGYVVDTMFWVDDATTQQTTSAFEPGKIYRLYIRLNPTDSYYFPSGYENGSVKVKVNGTEYTVDNSYQPGTACIWHNYYGYNISIYFRIPGANCQITYDANGGTGTMDGVIVEENNQLTLPECTFDSPTIYKEFEKWQIGSDYYLPGEKVTITAATTVKAIWADVETYTVSYAMNGHGTTVNPVTDVPRNSFLSSYTSAVDNDGSWSFGGWYTDAELTQQVDDNDRVTSDTILYACWYRVVDEVSITGIVKPEIGNTPTTSGITTNADTAGYVVDTMFWVDDDTTQQTTSAFEPGKTYRLFIRLNPTVSSKFPSNYDNGGTKVKVNGNYIDINDSYQAGTACLWSNIYGYNISIYYKTPNEVSFETNGGSSVASQLVNDGSKATKPSDPTKSGYTFGGWYTDSACTKAYDFGTAVTANVTLYAKWTATSTPAPSTPAPTTPAPVETPKLTSGVAHVQDIGNVTVYPDSDGVLTIGTTGQGKRLEEITINFENNTPYSGTLEYRVHVQDKGWMEWVPAGTKCGTEGLSLRIEAIEIRLTGELAEYYSVEYCVHIQDYGDMQGWVHDGALAGTTGESKRIEELKINIVPKGIDETTAVMYRVHVQDYGWEKTYACNGAMSGTSGESKRLEGIELFLSGVQYSGGIKYKTHVQDYGWQDWCYDGEMSGTQGESKRLEGICIELYGEIANYYDIYYRVHAQDIGWMGWAKNGACAGTAGRSARLEGIQIVLVPKGSPAPGATYDGITAVTETAFIEGF